MERESGRKRMLCVCVFVDNCRIAHGLLFFIFRIYYVLLLSFASLSDFFAQCTHCVTQYIRLVGYLSGYIHGLSGRTIGVKWVSFAFSFAPR